MKWTKKYFAYTVNRADGCSNDRNSYLEKQLLHEVVWPIDMLQNWLQKYHKVAVDQHTHYLWIQKEESLPAAKLQTKATTSTVSIQDGHKNFYFESFHSFSYSFCFILAVVEVPNFRKATRKISLTDKKVMDCKQVKLKQKCLTLRKELLFSAWESSVYKPHKYKSIRLIFKNQKIAREELLRRSYRSIKTIIEVWELDLFEACQTFLVEIIKTLQETQDNNLKYRPNVLHPTSPLNPLNKIFRFTERRQIARKTWIQFMRMSPQLLRKKCSESFESKHRRPELFKNWYKYFGNTKRLAKNMDSSYGNWFPCK